MHETIPDNKISKINKVDKQETPPVTKKIIKQPPAFSELPSMIDLDIEKGALENSKDKKLQEPKVYYSPRDFAEKPSDSKDHQSEDEELLNDEVETQRHQSPIGRINRTTYSGSAIGAMMDGNSSNSNSGSKQY